MERRTGRGPGDGSALGAGTLVRQLWSFAGEDDRDDVSQMLIQPFINYNTAKGWYLVTFPIITIHWQAYRDNAAVVLTGGVAYQF